MLFPRFAVGGVAQMKGRIVCIYILKVQRREEKDSRYIQESYVPCALSPVTVSSCQINIYARDGA